MSVRSFLHFLKSDFDFPFASEPSLARYMTGEGMRERVAPEAEPDTAGFDKHHIFEADRSRFSQIMKAKRWVFTGAQNNTQPNFKFLQALEMYCTDVGAKLVIRPIRYKNPTNRNPKDDEDTGDMWWHEAVMPYLLDVEIELKDVLIPDVRIQATAAHPLTGLDARSGVKHGVYAATQLAMKTIPTRAGDLPKILYATGAVTEENYSTTKAGNLAEFHHSLSAVIVEEDPDGDTFMRAVSWDGEKFYDLDMAYYPDHIEEAPPWAALIPGDEHAGFVDPKVQFATYSGPESMVSRGNPKYIVRHDLFDSYSVSHWHNSDRILGVLKDIWGRGDLRGELETTIQYLNETSQHESINVIIQSNHNDHLVQWLAKGERWVTPENTLLYHELMVGVLKSAYKTHTKLKYIHPFEAYCENKLTHETIFQSEDESFMVAGIELTMHGHRGPNGSRGSAMNLSKIGVKCVIGHSHSPQIYGSATQVGTSSYLDLEYAKGPSSWLHCHCILHENGKRQLLPIINGKWFARD